MSTKKNKKRVSACLTLQFTDEEKRWLDEIAAKDRRSLAGEIFWLIEQYHRGDLDDVQKVVMPREADASFLPSRVKKPCATFCDTSDAK